jgi:hypothetical protein
MSMLRHLQMNINRVSTEHEQSINTLWCCIWYNPRVKRRLLLIIEVLATSIGNVVIIVVTTQNDARQLRFKPLSTEHQQGIKEFGCCICKIQGWCNCVYPKSTYWLHLGAIWSVSMSLHLEMSVNRASTEHPMSINNLGCCILNNPRAVLQHLPILNVIPAVISKRDRNIGTSQV